MNFFKIELPPTVRTGDPICAEHYNKLIAAVALLEKIVKAYAIKSSADIGVKKATSAGVKLFLKRRNNGAGTKATRCDFGEIIRFEVGDDSTSEMRPGIRGGTIEAGKKTWRMPPLDISAAGEGSHLVWIRTEVTANLDPDEVVTLSGLDTSEQPTWETSAYDPSASDPAEYEDKVVPVIFPTADKGKGVSIVPIGILTIGSTGGATFEPEGCGGIIINHCPGNLFYIRGSTNLGGSSGE